MAAWQYDLLLVPRASVFMIYGEQPAVIDRETLDTALWWSGIRPDTEAFSALLERGTPWHPEILTWGEEDGDRIDVSLEDGAVREMLARVDVRRVDARFLADVIDLAADWDCLFVASDGRVISPTPEGLCQDIRRSTAWQFVSDPEGFLDGMLRQSGGRRRASKG